MLPQNHRQVLQNLTCHSIDRSAGAARAASCTIRMLNSDTARQEVNLDDETHDIASRKRTRPHSPLQSCEEERMSPISQPPCADNQNAVQLNHSGHDPRETEQLLVDDVHGQRLVATESDDSPGSFKNSNLNDVHLLSAASRVGRPMQRTKSSKVRLCTECTEIETRLVPISQMSSSP
ncbi:hypothetical protein FVE85_6538 [Porphyridium purpureum]|uniref:Uncharacterized protein n=1 Tax=Porphyridium purpureum TaxID=35688 RepID=A0A5J4Z7Z6_PORPP|nr:hypothetical protein FVE85_6538 [Porphyridium purpureum]|eukprot:POR3646..scf295_1